MTGGDLAAALYAVQGFLVMRGRNPWDLLQVVTCSSAVAFGVGMIAGILIARWMVKRAIDEVRNVR